MGQGGAKTAITSRARSGRLVISLAVAVGTILTATPARAQDIVQGQLALSASYGFLATFYQTNEANGLNPHWGHGVFLRLGGERCGRVCVGLSAVGSVGVSPSSTGSVGGGPHIGFHWAGPDWAGAYHFRLGAAYYHLWTAQPSFDNGEIELGDSDGHHGVGAWFALGLELFRRPDLFNFMIGLKGRYAAVVSADPVEHQLSAQAFIGITFGRRLVFGEGEELELGDDASDQQLDDGEGERDEDERFELDEEEERLLRETEQMLQEND